MTQDTIEIVNGPSKFDLMLSLFEGNPEPRHTVHFVYCLKGSRVKVHREVAITLVQQESGSGDSWNFQGTTRGESSNYRVRGHYSTQTRTGTFTILD